MQVAPATATPHLVEAIAPVDAEETEHREVEADADTGRALQVEGSELIDVGPRIAGLREGKREDGGVGLEHEGEAELERELRVEKSGKFLIMKRVTIFEEE